MNIMIFDLQISGHHPGYILHILRHWPDPNTTLTLVVSPEFLPKHRGVVETHSEATVTWCPITADELQRYTASKSSPLRQAWIEWQLFCHYARKNNSDLGLVMYIDLFQIPLSLRLPIPCPISGIYFRPKFHYTSFKNHRPAKGEWLKALREQLVWRSALRYPRLKTLFSLDLLAVEPLRRLGGSADIRHLPDPVEVYPASTTISSLKQRLGIDLKRKVFLLFGALDRRKGIYQVLDALKRLSEEEQAQITLLLIGKLAEPELIRAEIHAVEQATAVQIILQDRFVPEKEIQSYFEIADIVLALYQHHVGMSGILLHAAAAGKPVLASDYGLMGELVQQNNAGLIVDSTQPLEIAKGMRKFFTNSLIEMYDAHVAQEFANNNSAKNFVETLFKNLTLNRIL